MPEIADEIANLDYTFGYFRDLSPPQLRLCALNKGVRFEVGGALRYLELGMGQGVSLAVHAAANEGEFWGNDYNPSHVAHAQELVAAIGKPVHPLEDSFRELAAREDLPQFDIIGLHGIWSWVTDDDRAAIMEIAKRQLRPGGLLYVSYNCAFGWSAALPLRGLMRLYADKEASRALSTIERSMAGMAFAERLASLGASYFMANPTVAAQLRAAVGKDKTYLAHEFFGSSWTLFSLANVSQQLAAADLEFVTSMLMLEHDDDNVLTPEAQAAYSELTDRGVKEAFKECFINPQFRCDLFVKRPFERLRADEREAAWLSQRIMLTMPPSFIPHSVPGPRGPVRLDQSICVPLAARLAENGFRPRTVAEVAEALPASVIGDVIRQVVNLIALKAVNVVQSESAAERTKADCRALNRLILERSLSEGRINVLASPVLAAGINLARLRQFFLLARLRGASSIGDVAEFALRCCEQTGEPVVHNGVAAVDADARREALMSSATSFSQYALPILQAAGVDPVQTQP
jgi:SAM-dependent methyltransferase